jgi:hypothetical protein
VELLLEAVYARAGRDIGEPNPGLGRFQQFFCISVGFGVNRAGAIRGIDKFRTQGYDQYKVL